MKLMSYWQKISFKNCFDKDRILISDERQNIKEWGKDFAVIRIKQTDLKLKDTIKFPVKDKQFEKYLTETLYVQATDPEIKETAKEIVGEESNSYQAVKYLNLWVCSNIQKSNSFLFAGAKEVLNTGAGDCTEHAVLLCALARSLGIPSKICFGITYGEGSFSYHAWTEVYVGEWLAMDPTTGQYNIDATHIKFVDSDLASSSLSQANIKGLEIKQKIKKIEILEYVQK